MMGCDWTSSCEVQGRDIPLCYLYANLAAAFVRVTVTFEAPERVKSIRGHLAEFGYGTSIRAPELGRASDNSGRWEQESKKSSVFVRELSLGTDLMAASTLMFSSSSSRKSLLSSTAHSSTLVDPLHLTTRRWTQ